MHKKTGGMLTIILTFFMLTNIITGCGGSADSGPSLKDIPRYPDATEGESMGQSGFGGIVGGNLAQFTTADDYEDVVDFYDDALLKFDPEVMSHTSELGRQTAFSIPRKTGMISVAIQEFIEEGKVNITFMGVGI
ncbi:hypothetical protein ACFL7E_07065 [Thermodesulfobacteriota bacterium]